jgi:hypothetical protein
MVRLRDGSGELNLAVQRSTGLDRPGIGPGAGRDHVARRQVGRARALAKFRQKVKKGLQRAVQHVGARALFDKLSVFQQRHLGRRELMMQARGG